MAEVIAGAIFMFVFKEGSRNAYNNDRRDAVFAKNYHRVFGKRLPHPDTVDHVLRVLPPDELEALKATLVGALFEQKMLRRFRFLGKYYYVAIDATGVCSFDHPHCPHCLTKTSKNGVETWFHYVLEAKLVTSSGLAISLASEFVANQPGRNYEKQDCELKAFERLAKKIKAFYPRLPICILADGLYPNNTVFDICRAYGWKFIITLKDNALKSFNTEAGLLSRTACKQAVFRRDKTQMVRLEYRFLNGIPYGGHNYSWVCCDETRTRLSDKKSSQRKFIFITNIEQEKDTVVSTADGGRIRWKVENEGFNTQKNHGYDLSHKYSRVSFGAMINYYLAMQIAHLINQLAEKSSEISALMVQHSKQTIQALWKDLVAFMKTVPIQTGQLELFLSG